MSEAKPEGQLFEHFKARFIARHPEWYGEFESARARDRGAIGPVGMDAMGPVEMNAIGRVPSAAPAPGLSEIDLDVAEEVRDEEAEAEEAAALLSE